MTMEVQKGFKNIQHSCHLSEDKHSMATGLQPSEQDIQRLQFPCLKQKKFKANAVENNIKNTSSVNLAMHTVTKIRPAALYRLIIQKPMQKMLN